MYSIVIIDTFQVILNPTRIGADLLDLVFVSGKMLDDVKMKEISITPLPWSNHALIKLQLLATHDLCRTIFRWSTPVVYWIKLVSKGKFLSVLARSSVKCLINNWQWEANWALNSIVHPPSHLFRSQLVVLWDPKHQK